MTFTRGLAAWVLVLSGVACDKMPHPGEKTQGLAGAAPRFTLFETGQVRPLALRDGRLYALNTPDNRLEVFDVRPNGLQWRGSVVVGLEPIAVALGRDQEVWVVNHLSDSVSIVNVSDAGRPRVVRTLLVGDEPRDIVFAGPGMRRAFITTAHRGQNSPNDPQLQTPGIPRADVWVFDADNLGASLGGTPLTIVSLFTDTPRALAVTPDGSRVYAAGFHTGNRTTSINELLIPDGGEGAGGLPGPRTDSNGEPQPETGLIVKHNGSHWVDQLGRNWDSQVNFNLPDKDVFALDALANPPHEISYFTGVGTVLYNMAVNPVNGKVYVANTEALNQVRFAGPGVFGGSSVRGHMHESRVTVLSSGSVLPRHLNKHIDYGHCCADLPNAENARSLAIPLQMEVSSNGATLYLAAFGSSKVGVYSTAQLEADSFVPDTSNQIAVSGGGPSGLALDEPNHRLYVLTRFDNSISIVDTGTRSEISHIALFNPEPQSVVRGRPFLYDAARTSSHGDSACASCHVFGDFDSLAWDLGDPEDVRRPNYNPTFPNFNPFYPPQQQEANAFAPMKGPMTTQSLRGLANHGPMHWRGDRTGSGPGVTNAQPNGGSYDENAAFNAFNVAFNALNGRSQPLATADMQAFTDFALQISYPPNPIRNLDNSLTPDQAEGQAHFVMPRTDDRCPPGVNCDEHPELQFACVTCHTEDENGNAQFGVPFPGFFGASGESFRITFDPVRSQAIKNPHLRNLYQKVGMFGMPQLFVLTPFGLLPGTQGTGFMGDQVRGFGYIHDGSFDTVDEFVSNASFANFTTLNGFPFGPPGQEQRRKLAAYLLAFESNLKPIVGQQITWTQANAAATQPRVDLLLSLATLGDCELVAKIGLPAREKGFLYDAASGRFVSDESGAASLSAAALQQQAANRELTYTAVPIGSGRRIGIDADLDGYLDGDEIENGSDPRNPSSTP
jgi:DNA-binding beta-propeller fold protein YncE